MGLGAQKRQYCHPQDLSIKAINERAAALHGALGGLKNGRFASAWGLFVGENQAVKQKYLDDCERELALPSTFKQLDKDTGNTFLGSWADDNTGGRIKSVNFTIPGGSAPFFVDLNTADPDWQEAMDPTRTRALPFHPESGDGNPVPMLNCVMNCGVHTGSEGSLAVLPFAGDETRLVVMLPPEGTGVHDFLPVAAAHHDEWLKDAVWKEQRVLLPRVTLAAEGSVKPVLAGAGFDVLSSGANHDGMGNGLGLADVLQKTELVVDESGQQDTGNTADYNPDQPDDIPTFTVDRPYVLLLEDGKTGAILMAAVVRDPLSGGTSAK